MPLNTVQIPANGKILVREGQEVAVGDPLIQAESPREILNLASLLNVNPKNVKKLLTKAIGQEVKKGEIISQKSGLLKKSKLKSPTDGILEKLDEQSGFLTIKLKGEDFTLKSTVGGKVVKIKEGDCITLEAKGLEIKAQRGIGPRKEGKIEVLKSDPVCLGDLNLESAGKILAAKNWACGSLSKAKALGAEGILAQQVEDDDFSRAASSGQGKDLVILVFSPENFEKVLKYNNYQVTIWGDEKSLMVGSDGKI